ncbi:MAG TPA: NAD-dependent epimerase/dehydratase family protein [Candidatus Polarisedimenticolia bacterium]|nr:NAD-dependent epimerase/dehydratase family protein [Candidatus Polarisedimenticolia bacterium]
MGGFDGKLIRPSTWLKQGAAGIGVTIGTGRQGRWARFRSHLTFESFARVAADAVIVNLCFLAALIVRLLLETSKGDPDTTGGQLGLALSLYASHAWLLTSICLGVYALTGFYTKGPLYRGRLKALAVLHAVSLAYVLFGFVQYLAEAKSWLTVVPRLALFMGWGLTLVATAASRLWSNMWRTVIEREKPMRPELNRKGPIRRVLVIGGAGYIGSVLCRQLLEQGYSVRVLDALLYGKDSLTDLEQDPRFELIVGDSRDIGSVFSAMLGADAVVHLGELVGDPACALDEKLTLEINLAATRMLAEAARGYGVKRFIYASSCSVYGLNEELLDESSELNPVSLYARAKIGSETALLDLNDESFHPVILRLSTVFGLSPRPRFDLVVNLLAAKAAREGEVTVFGGSQWRPFVHVSDVARAMVCCLQAPLESVKGQVFNVGSDDHNYSIQQIGEMAHSLVPSSRLVSEEDSADRRNYRVSFAKIRTVLGFTCHRTVESGMREIIGALNDGRIRDHRLARYSNHKTLSDPNGQPGLRRRHISDLYQPAPRMPLRPVSVGGRQ